MADSGKKLFVGPRFRRIRQQLGLSQTQIAEGLGISPSYVNLIERNQRPVTAQILLRLAETYDLDLRDLATADEDRFFAELNEIFSDPLFRQIDVPKQELRDLAELCPGVTHSLQRLYAAYTEARRGETLVGGAIGRPRRRRRTLRGQPDRARARPDRGQPQLFPRARTGSGNSARRDRTCRAQDLFAALSARGCAKSIRSSTRIMPVDVMRETLRRFDRHRRQLLISELVDGPGRAFQLAFQIGLAECGAHFRDDRRPRRPARRHAAPALPHHAGELFRGRRHDALSGISLPRRKRWATTSMCWRSASTPASSRSATA